MRIPYHKPLYLSHRLRSVIGGGRRCQVVAPIERSFSSAEASSPEDPDLPTFGLSSTILGLFESPTIIKPHIKSIIQLPEVADALSANNRPVKFEQIDGLRRATDVFASFQKGGNEHCATLALLAEYWQMNAKYSESIAALEELKEYCSVEGRGKGEMADVSLALSKAFWLNGEFDQGKQECDNLLEGTVSFYSPYQELSALTGHAINRLMLVDTLDDVFSVRDPFRMVVKQLEGTPSLGLALSLLNFGVAEVVYAHVVERERKVDVPLDGALRAWRQGLTTLKRASSKNKTLHMAIEARLRSNMAWALLQMKGAGDRVDQASEFAGDALKIYDSEGMSFREGFGRTLALVATCYHKTSSAVTAEGLFQSSLGENEDLLLINPLAKLDIRDSIRGYADLCRDWDRREADAERLDQKAAAVESSMPDAWQGKLGIFSSLWFFTSMK